MRPPAKKVPLGLEPGMEVLVLTDEGALRRGRRRWHPGRSVGVVERQHRLHTRGWHVLVNSHSVILFEDELALIPKAEEASA